MSMAFHNPTLSFVALSRVSSFAKSQHASVGLVNKFREWIFLEVIPVGLELTELNYIYV